MTDPHSGEDHAEDHLTDEQAEVAEDSRQSGGDAPAAGSIREREQVATDDDDLFGTR